MSVVAQVFALTAALVHLLAFSWESVLFERPGVHRDIFRIPTADVPPVRLWAFNVGFYNLFLAAGPIAGVIARNTGHPVVGRTLVLYSCAFMSLAGIVLFVSDRRAMSRPKGAGMAGSLAQTVPALGALIAVLV
jgi:putative membrane protein